MSDLAWRESPDALADLRARRRVSRSTVLRCYPVSRLSDCCPLHFWSFYLEQRRKVENHIRPTF